jgi:hypothetical protein
MPIKPIAIASVASFVCAFAAASWVNQLDLRTAEVPGDAVDSFDQDLPVEQRIAALEQAVSDERQARQLLQEEVFYLTSELEILADLRIPPRADESPVESQGDESRDSRREEIRRRNSREGRVERLVAAGFLPSQADWILQREQELQMEALQERFDAERSGEPIDWMANRNQSGDALREELGEADYERYLDANNRSTNVSVSSVIESSPAQVAGLQPGDEIFRYDGQRVFSMTDLTRQTMVGEPGQNVVVDVMRNGNLVQVVMPRGPVLTEIRNVVFEYRAEEQSAPTCFAPPGTEDGLGWLIDSPRCRMRAGDNKNDNRYSGGQKTPLHNSKQLHRDEPFARRGLNRDRSARQSRTGGLDDRLVWPSRCHGRPLSPNAQGNIRFRRRIRFNGGPGGIWSRPRHADAADRS